MIPLNVFLGLICYLVLVLSAYVLVFYLLFRNSEKRLFKRLEDKLRSDNPLDRINAVVKLSTMGLKAKDFVPRMVELLHDSDEDVTYNTKYALLKLSKDIKKSKGKYHKVLTLINSAIPDLLLDDSNSKLSASLHSKRAKYRKDKRKKR